ncbi:MAG: YncE family protein [Anaerolineae bacterium]|nr:YncE family protein [Anaerolineae bacterium]
MIHIHPKTNLDALRRFTVAPLCLFIPLAFLLLGLGLAATPASPSRAETPVLSVTGAASDTYPGSETAYRIELLNHSDQIVYDGVISITLPVGFSYVPGSTLAMGEGWPMQSHEPVIDGQTLTWGPYHMPAAGVEEHNPYGSHTMVNFCETAPGLHLEGAKMLAGNGGYVTQLFYPIDPGTTGPSQCAINYVVEAYARNLIPILRLQGHFVNGVWQAPNPGARGDYAEIAQAYARFVAGLPRRDTNPLYIEVWNEPDLWIEWSGKPNAAQYARFFVAVSNAIRQLGDARIRVINGALTPGNPTFLKQMLAVPGFRDAFDVWSSHCYPYNHPPSYNLHHGTARYGTYAIDCYRSELAILKSYGRSNVKVILTETGYELGNNTFGFEGFSRINETNRANYMVAAFATYWQNWPEVVAVTPFELGDASGHWANFDWVYPSWPYPKHPQFDAVAALPKPGGALRPYGYQISFRASVDGSVALGVYPSQLRGSERNGNTALATDAAPVLVRDPAQHYNEIYLPLIFGPLRRDGPWYMSVDPPPSPGAIVPSDFLKSGGQPPATLAAAGLTALLLPLATEANALALSEETGLGAIALVDSTTGGRLQVFNLQNGQTVWTIPLDDAPQMLAVNAAPDSDSRLYVSLADGLAGVDLSTGKVVARASGLGRLRGIARDAATGRLFVADAGREQLLVLSDDSLQPLATLPFAHQPDQLVFDGPNRRVYVSFPAVPQVLAIDTDTLAVTAQATLMGGPILDLALDADHNRLYALNALAPDYRGVTVWQATTLSPIAVVGGSGDFPLRTASALAITPSGELLASETTGLWQIDPANFAVTKIYPTGNQAPPDGLAVSRSQGIIYMLDPQSGLFRIFR